MRPHNEITINIKYTGNKIGEMAECELRQRKKEGDDGIELQESNEEIKSVGSDQVQTENKSELVRYLFGLYDSILLRFVYSFNFIVIKL